MPRAWVRFQLLTFPFFIRTCPCLVTRIGNPAIQLNEAKKIMSKSYLYWFGPFCFITTISTNLFLHPKAALVRALSPLNWFPEFADAKRTRRCSERKFVEAGLEPRMKILSLQVDHKKTRLGLRLVASLSRAEIREPKFSFCAFEPMSLRDSNPGHFRGITPGPQHQLS